MAIDRVFLLRCGAVLLPGALLYFLPLPGFDAGQRHLVAIFLATIVALVARPATEELREGDAAILRELDPARAFAGAEALG